MLKRIGGVLALLAGIGLGAFVIYAVFVTDDPDMKVRRPGKMIGFAIGAVCLGIYWLQGASAEKAETPAIEEA